VKDLVVRSLKEGEEGALFDFVQGLPQRGLWGKKTRYLTDYQRFLRILKYAQAFRLSCLLVAEEKGKTVGFAIAVQNRRWISELAKRYRCKIEKRAHILGIAFNEGRKDILNGLAMSLKSHFSKDGIKCIEYPTFGNICLTTATDVLTPENVDALVMFREAGFRISDCYYSMSLNLESQPSKNEHRRERTHFRIRDRRLEFVMKNQVLGKITWDPIQKGTTSIGVFIKQAYRGKGVGKALMAETLHYLGNEGVKSVELGADGNNLPALKLYRRFGFKVCTTHFYLMLPC
jgi:phosphinothricin acetyltransferase